MRTSPAESDSPARFTARRSGRFSDALTKTVTADGTVFTRVIGSRASPTFAISETRTTLAPTAKDAQSSKADRSKFMEVLAKIHATSVSVNASLAQLTRFTMFRCSIITPFGRPVEPDV